MDIHHFGPKYPTCDHVKRPKAELTVTQDLLKQISNEAKILPLFEQRLYQLKHKRNSSLVRNDFLACRWTEFVKKRAGKNQVPFQFPSVNDYHFYKCQVCYEPKETTSNRVTNRFHLKNGPGVDHFGQMPIPDDMHMRKSSAPPTSKLVKNVKCNKKSINRGTDARKS